MSHARRRKADYTVTGYGREGLYSARTPGAAVRQFIRDSQPEEVSTKCGAPAKVKQFQPPTDHENGGWVGIQVEAVSGRSA